MLRAERMNWVTSLVICGVVYDCTPVRRSRVMFTALSITSPAVFSSELMSPDVPVAISDLLGTTSLSGLPNEMSIALSPSTPRPVTRATESRRMRS